MQGFYKWSHYLWGYNTEVEVLTDHQNLMYFQKPQNLNQQQARWILDLQEYNFTIKHWLGKSNTKADLLSRRADYPQGENNNQDIILFKQEHFCNIKINLSEDDMDWIYLMDDIRKTHRQYYDKQVDWAIKEVFTLPHAFLKESLGTPGISRTPQGISRNFPDSCLQKWPLILGQNEPGVCQDSLWSPCEIRDFSRTPQDWPFKESLRSARSQQGLPFITVAVGPW